MFLFVGGAIAGTAEIDGGLTGPELGGGVGELAEESRLSVDAGTGAIEGKGSVAPVDTTLLVVPHAASSRVAVTTYAR
jgi:hypothetical protein